MTLFARLAGCSLAILLATSTFAQDVYDDPPPPATEIPTEGFWPTQKMMNRMLDRILDGLADHYELDEEQVDLSRQLFQDRFPTFLEENRAEIQTLMNQYFEALLDEGPPTPEDVAAWSQRLQPLVAQFGELIIETSESMHEYLNDDQITQLDAEMAAFQAGMTMVQNKLSIWSSGGYDPTTEWIRDTPPPPPPADPDDENAPPLSHTARKDRWTTYTEQFIDRYQLNDEQQQKAFTFLRRQQERRDAFLKHNAPEMEKVTAQLTNAETDEQRRAALEAYKGLSGPVDRLFEQLTERLETLPTRAQRRDAIEAGRVSEEDATPGMRRKPPQPDDTDNAEETEPAEPDQPLPEPTDPE